MFIVRPQAQSPIAIFGEDGKLLGTIKLFPRVNGDGRAALGFDFPKWIKIQMDYNPNRVKTVVEPPAFGDFNPDEFEVPAEAGNGFEYE